MSEHENLDMIRMYDRWKKSGTELTFKEFVDSENRAGEIFNVFNDIFNGVKE